MAISEPAAMHCRHSRTASVFRAAVLPEARNGSTASAHSMRKALMSLCDTRALHKSFSSPTKYGYWRPYIINVINRYLDCGDPHFGFARVKCENCKNEYILPFSCKRRHFCPSCHQKRVVEFGEHLYEEVLKNVSHRQWVFSLPKRLRPYFMYDRKMLAKLSRCAWKVLSDYIKQSVPVDNPMPGAVISVQTFGEFLNFNPHLHIIATNGCFYGNGEFMTGLEPDAKDLEVPFAMEVFNMLKKEGKINGAIINNMLN